MKTPTRVYFDKGSDVPNSWLPVLIYRGIFAPQVLGIAEGRVTVKLGGENGGLFRLKSGDLLVLPAGVGHRRIGSDQGLKVVGAYPPGQSHFDMKRTGRAIPECHYRRRILFTGKKDPF